jgi:hypothetical protein
MATTFLVAAAAVIVAMGLSIPWFRRRAEQRKLLAREALDNEAIYSRFYASAGLPRDQVFELWGEVAETLGVPPDRLRPEDRFGKDVGTYWIMSDALDELAKKGRQRAQQLGVTIDLKTLATVDQYVRCFARADR